MRFQDAFILLGVLCVGAQFAIAAERKATPAVVNPALRSPLRETISLDGTWDFATDPEGAGEDEQWFLPGKDLPGKVFVRVPGCWEAQGVGGPGNSVSSGGERNINPLRGCYVGTAWYRKEVPIPHDWAGKQVWLKVGGVNAQGWFWVNGAYVAHVGTYCGTYKYNITDLVRPGEKAVVAIKVRNDVAGGKGLFGWVHRFGGLYRSVELDATAEVLIDYAYVEGDFDERKARVCVKLRSLSPDDGAGAHCEVGALITTLRGKKVAVGTGESYVMGSQTKDVEIELALEPLVPWSPANPHLYKAEISLKLNGKKIDGWVERFGVRKWEVRGRRFYLNGKRFFVRGYGDDYIYPLTLCSPASREAHKKNLQIAKDFGFVYVRHHTHCELPEFFDAADEVGIMVQPELPYWGTGSSASDGSPVRPKGDLAELVTHYRRHVSLATYCFGNEGHMGSPIDKELYQLAKELDPTRLVIHQDGGRGNNAENSDYWTIPHQLDDSRPMIIHEYTNLGTDEDPRLAEKYTGAIMPPCPLEPFKKELEDTGLSLEWGYACIDAGNGLQRIYQKRSLERARMDPNVDGYSFWTILDCGRPSAQGLLNQFWEPKASTAESFRQFNGPIVLLAKFTPRRRILAEGDELKIEWWISHFADIKIKNKTLAWKVIDTNKRFIFGNKTLQSGEIPGVTVARGDVKAIGAATFKVPPLKKAIKAELSVEFVGTNAGNSWDLWLFPKIEPKAGAGEGLCASQKVHTALAGRYPGMTKLGSPEAADAGIILTDSLNGGALKALEDGKNVILLKLKGINPGVKLGWWWKCPQVGTAVARHRAFGGFPHDGYLGEQFFRLTQSTVRMNKGGYNNVDHLMLGYGYDRRAECSGGKGNMGYLLYVFQARVGKGKILASGLNLLSPHPESAYLLNEFIRYVKSKHFKPKGLFDVSKSAVK